MDGIGWSRRLKHFQSTRTSSYPPSHPSREPLNHTSWTNQSNKGKHWHQTQSIIYVYSLQYLSYSLIVFICRWWKWFYSWTLIWNLNDQFWVCEHVVHWVVCTPEGIFEPESTSRQRVQQNKFCCIPGPKGTFFSIYILENAQRHWNKSLPGEQQEPVVASVFWGLTRDKTCCPIRHSLGLQEKVQLNYNSASLSFCLACLTANPAAPIFAPC